MPGRTGLDATDDYKSAAILFTGVLPDGTVTLSRPLPGSLAAGAHPASILAYRPFERPRLADGSPNPAFEETMAGWLEYVEVVTRRTREILGSTEFDVEVWNELGFGSDFLDANSYYSPAPNLGVGDTEQEILERTIAFIRDPARGLQGVGIGNGFSNQRPWEAGSTSPVGLDGDRQASLPGHAAHARRREHRTAARSTAPATSAESRSAQTLGAMTPRPSTTPSSPSTTSRRSRPSIWSATSRRSPRASTGPRTGGRRIPPDRPRRRCGSRRPG